MLQITFVLVYLLFSPTQCGHRQLMLIPHLGPVLSLVQSCAGLCWEITAEKIYSSCTPLSYFIYYFDLHICDIYFFRDHNRWYSSPPQKPMLIDGHDISLPLFLSTFSVLCSVTPLNPAAFKSTFFSPTAALLVLSIKSLLNYRFSSSVQLYAQS